MNAFLPATYTPDPNAAPYRPDPDSMYRVKFAFRVDFTNGGHVQGEDFILDIDGEEVAPARLAEMIVSSMNLLRAGTVTISSMKIVRRGENQDARLPG